MIKMICATCGSDQVTRDACTRWNIKGQHWELVTVYDNADCEVCEGECSIREVEI